MKTRPVQSAARPLFCDSELSDAAPTPSTKPVRVEKPLPPPATVVTARVLAVIRRMALLERSMT